SSSPMERNTSPVSCTTFNELRLEGEHFDVTISVDGVQFNAHKIILCRCSNYFRALLSSRWSTTEKTVHNIPGTSPEMMKLIIEYAYNGTVPVTADNVGSLLNAADYLNVMGIVRLCCQFLQSHLCLENCISTWKLTDTYYCPDLREAARVFILHHFKELVEVSTEFTRLSIDELIGIIGDDELNVRQEGAVFEAVLKWVAYDPQKRRQHIPLLLSKVRLALVTSDYFLSKVRKHKYLKDNEECKGLIMDALTEMYRLSMYGPASSACTNPLGRPRLPHAIMWAIGGWSGETPTNAMETYDARADQWLNVTCEEVGPLAYHGTAYLKGFIYVIGGFDSMDCLSSVKRFDPLQRRWQEVAPMHSQRCYVSVTTLSSNIYAMGGFDGHLRLNTAERYDPETNQWTMISPMHEERSDASATTLNEKVYICGGFNGNECLITAEVYNPTKNQWTFIAPMGRSRSGLGVIAYENKVYAVGGFDGFTQLQSVEAYHPVTNTWDMVPSMFSPRSNFGIEVLEDRLFVVGGFNGFSTTFNTEYYDRATNEWYNVHDMGIHRSALSCSVMTGLSNVQEYVSKRD
ncbi:KLH10 protein, partial [Brachypteracias leptosomus]|nr:KLH10 protein [Brachypteracias leptosomus]